MADGNAMADIRGLDIQKLVVGFSEEDLVLEKFVNKSPTSAREVRWYQKTAGWLDSTDTTAITASQIANTASKALPFVVEQTWTRNTSYIKKYFVESPLISDEDLRDSDVDILATNLHDLTRAVQRQVELAIYNVITESDTPATIQTVAITNEWDDYANCNPIEDLLKAKEYLVNYAYNPEGAIFAMRPDVMRFLITWLISTKGSSIPGFSSQKVESGVVMELLGIRCVTTTAVTSDKAVLFVSQTACTLKEFLPITSYIVDDPGLGKKIRIAREVVPILTDPKSVVFFSNIGPT